MEYNNTDIVNIKYQLVGANDLGMRECKLRLTKHVTSVIC